MHIEHFAYVVADPVATAAWYAAHLGMRIIRAGGAPTFTHFLADSSGEALIEIYNNPRVTVPDYPSIDPLIIHLAFQTDDVAGTRERLLAAGATPAGGIDITPAGDELAMLRDPWGFPIQLAKRAEPMRG